MINRQISIRIGCDRRFVDRFVSRRKGGESSAPKRNISGPKISTTDDDRAIKRIFLQDRIISLDEVKMQTEYF